MQASVTAMRFRNCKPHYLWLPLKRKTGEKETAVGELHLRIQWTSDEMEKPQEALPTWALDVQLRGVGLSVIEAKMLNFPREVSYSCPGLFTIDNAQTTGHLLSLLAIKPSCF